MQCTGIKENRNGSPPNKRLVHMPKEKLNRRNLEDIMIEVIYLLKLIIKALLIESLSQ